MKRILAPFLVLAALAPSLAWGQNFSTIGGYGSCSPGAPCSVTGSTAVPSYSAAAHNFGNSSTGDILCVTGSATKAVRVKQIRASAIASAAVNSSLSVSVRSSLNTGGTPTTLTAVPNDSQNSTATAVVTAYATAPTAGTLVGRVRAQKLSIPTTSATAFAPNPAVFSFANNWDQPIVLRGATQALCLDVDSTAGGNWELDVEWTEEAN